MDRPRRTVLGIGDTTATRLHRLSMLLAVAVIAVGFLTDRQWFDYRPGGVTFPTDVRPTIIAMFGVAALIAIRFEMLGAVVGAFTSGTLMTFAARQLWTTQAVIVVAALLIPVLLWMVVDLSRLRLGWGLLGLGATNAALLIGLLAGLELHDDDYGPWHPQSTLAEPGSSDVLWIWSGAITETSARVTAKSRVDGPFRLLVADNPDFANPQVFEPKSTEDRIVAFTATTLQPDTRYHYALEINGRLDTNRRGRFRTFPDGAASFRITAGSCARVGSNGVVFDTIRAADPLLHLILGDLHYGNIPDNERIRYEQALDVTLTRPAQDALYRSAPTAYVWDDHDYGPNDADARSPSRPAAMDAYRTFVPSYDLSGPETALFQAFTIGRVRVIITDARSNRVVGRTTLGADQKKWFIDELTTSAEDHAVVIWVNSIPWIGDERQDHWGGFPDERAEISQVIADHDIGNLMMVSGDAHMVAIDDGTNTNYANRPGPGFPLLQAAALDRRGGHKGGPYSHGSQPGAGQFGVIDVSDDGTTVTVRLEARNHLDEVIMSHEFTPRVPASLGTGTR